MTKKNNFYITFFLTLFYIVFLQTSFAKNLIVNDSSSICTSNENKKDSNKSKSLCEFYCSQITLDDLNLKETNSLFSFIKNSNNIILAKQIPDKKFVDLRNNSPPKNF